MTHQTFDIVMPSLGADMRDGMLTEWLVAEGDHVNKGDSIAVIETNKGAIEMESYHTGTISRLLVQPMSTLPVGAILANIDLDIETVTNADSDLNTQPPEQPPFQRQDQPLAAPAATPAQATDTSARSAASTPLASPVVRAMARQQQLNLQGITGTGPSGAILLRDLNTTHQAQQSNNAETPTISPTTKTTDTGANRRNQAAMRAAIGAAMEKSKREIPHYYLSHDVDLSAAQQWLSEQNAGRDPEERLLLPALLIKAVATLLPQFPTLNGFYQNGGFVQAQAIHIGTVISLREGGLMVPAIHNADQLSLNDTMLALRDISLRSRTGRLRSSELTDATITITNIGERGCDGVFGIIYPPQVAILGFGRLRQSPQVKNNQIEICDTLTITLSADHRVSDGIQGAKFLHALSQQLQQPEQL
ncbi:dihydrolipoamide acetyltransferase family protein [Photobacterium halotolerans]|uniref:dihydrolipoamide acetyltransferase family protein n=1 Tax=Photobacterium halotolerans TaxID=265726 RepID=UPI0003F59B3D|nr:dihydrolipoamide acetyltransferase family protein [Photobacterium halotolerans]